MPRLLNLALELLRGFAVLYLALWLATFINPWLGNFLPASILGMLLILAALQTRLLPIHWVLSSANLLVRWMALLFVPIGVGLVEQFALLNRALPAIIACCVLGTLVLLPLVGRAYQAWEKRA